MKMLRKTLIAIVMGIAAFTVSAYASDAPTTAEYQWHSPVTLPSDVQARVTSFTTNFNPIDWSNEEVGEVWIGNYIIDYYWGWDNPTDPGFTDQEEFEIFGLTFTGEEEDIIGAAYLLSLGLLAVQDFENQAASSQIVTQQVLDRVMRDGLLADFGMRLRSGKNGEIKNLNANFEFTGDALYEHTWYDTLVVDVESTRSGFTLRTGFQAETAAIDFRLFVDRVQFDSSFSDITNLFGSDFFDLDYTRLGLSVTPRLHLLKQKDHGVNLDLGLNAFYTHTFLDSYGNSDELLRLIGVRRVNKREDSNHLGMGPVIAMHKDFESMRLSLGAIWQHTWNLEGAKRYSWGKDDRDSDVVQIGMNVAVPVGERFVISGMAQYDHTFDLPERQEQRNFFSMGIGGAYTFQESSVLSLDVHRKFGGNYGDSIQAKLGFSWSF